MTNVLIAGAIIIGIPLFVFLGIFVVFRYEDSIDYGFARFEYWAKTVGKNKLK